MSHRGARRWRVGAVALLPFQIRIFLRDGPNRLAPPGDVPALTPMSRCSAISMFYGWKEKHVPRHRHCGTQAGEPLDR